MVTGTGNFIEKKSGGSIVMRTGGFVQTGSQGSKKKRSGGILRIRSKSFVRKKWSLEKNWRLCGEKCPSEGILGTP